ncbi:hypothetical protein PTKIN_Ptkin11bG0081600 [Pterospermum kingtungense]
MDEGEFRRLPDLFPVVRPRHHHVELDSSRQSTSRSALNKPLKDSQDARHEGERKEKQNQGLDLCDEFWQKLKLTAERKAFFAIDDVEVTMVTD